MLRSKCVKEPTDDCDPCNGVPPCLESVETLCKKEPPQKHTDPTSDQLASVFSRAMKCRLVILVLASSREAAGAQAETLPATFPPHATSPLRPYSMVKDRLCTMDSQDVV